MGRVLPKVFLFALVFRLSAACSYEKIGKRHTMCKYRERACPSSELIRSGNLSGKDKNLIVKAHNQLRSKLASGKVAGLPAAANMRVMAWDNELAMIAQRWADQCTFGHDELRNIEGGGVGQNVAAYWSYEYKDPNLGDKPDWSSGISLWEKEYDKNGFSSSNISPFVFKYDVGHYTQMVWADTHKIGCGYTFYKHPQRGYTRLYVCNYFPAGNMIQGTMYKVSSGGAACTDSSLKLSSEYGGLCDVRHYQTSRKIFRRKRRTLWNSGHENSRLFRFQKRDANTI